MNAQRSNAPLPGVRSKPVGASPRALSVAVTTAALPAVMLSSVALAQPATAAPAPLAPATRHLVSPVAHVPARAVVPAALVAVQVPSQRIAVAAATIPADYTIKPGDTVSAIAKRFGLTTDAVLTLNRMNARTVIYPGQKLKLSGGSAPKARPAPATAAPVTKTTASSYVVKPGDTLGAIASRNGVSLDSLLKANRLSMTSIIYPGQKLAISGKGPAAPAPAAPKPAAKPAPAPAPAPAGSYTIKPGDTLGAIASRSGVALSALLSANKMSMTTVIYPGRTLTIPGRGTTPAPAPAPAPTNLVPSSFLGYTYPDAVVADANANKALLNSLPAPSPAEMKKIVADTARSMGVDPSLALAFAFQESSFNQRSVSPANAIGTMQVIPSSGQWASDLVGRKLNLMDPYDNATAGIAIIRSLLRTSPSEEIAIASYYQGQYSVQSRGMYEDTKRYVAAIKGHQKNFR